MTTVGVLGGGAWGTALAVLARRAGRDVVLWARESEVVSSINEQRRNPVFLPDVDLGDGIRATADAGEALGVDVVLVAVPAQHLRTAVAAVAADWLPETPAILCAKGIERDTGMLPSEVVASILSDVAIGVLSGPTFATEAARGLPTAVTFAAVSTALRAEIPELLGSTGFRIYATADVIGAQLGGAVKNVLGIACGIVHGRDLGDNARAALLTRGLAEMARLAAAKGARAETLMGLSGLGDLVLTGTSPQSRNYTLGVALGEGRVVEDILAGRRSVIEGVATAASVRVLADRLGVDMPICAAVDDIVNGGADIDATIGELLARPFRAEALTAAHTI